MRHYGLSKPAADTGAKQTVDVASRARILAAVSAWVSHIPPPAKLLGYLGRLVALYAALLLSTALAVVAQTGYQVVPVWPLAGLGLAAMWHGGLRWWPAIFLTQSTITAYLGVPPLLAMTGGVFQTATVVLMLTLIRRCHVNADFGHVHNVLRYIGIAAIVGMLATAVFLLTMAVVARPLQGGAISAWGFYWLAEVLSFLLLTPAALVLAQGVSTRRLDWPRLLRGSAPLVLACLILPLLSEELRNTLFYTLLPLAVIGAAVAGVPGAMVASLLMVAALLLIAGLGEHTALDLWVRAAFVGATAVTAQLLAALSRERQQVTEKLIYQAQHDPLTGLANRAHFEDKLRELLTVPSAREHACLYIDLDQFKLLNDSCGHAAGDRLLESLAGELAAAMPEHATVARIGGDEFGVLLPNAGETMAHELAISLRDRMTTVQPEMLDAPIPVSASVGITLFDTHMDTPDMVLGRADVACYAAKDGTGVHLFRPDDERMLRKHSVIRTISELQSAWQSGRMSVHAQRIVPIGANESEDNWRYELLLRLEDSSPREFLPLADRYGMLRHVDEWMLAEAARLLAGRPRLHLSVNVSIRTLDSKDLYARVMEICNRYGCQPSQLCLEITETEALSNLLRAVRQLRRLRNAGFRLALDDFGAGVASFGYLDQLPVNEVKLDSRFVRDLATNPSSQVIVRSLVELAKIRGLTSTAEGVQSQTSLAELRKLGIGYVQGFAIHRPEPIADILERLDHRPRSQRAAAQRQ